MIRCRKRHFVKDTVYLIDNRQVLGSSYNGNIQNNESIYYRILPNVWSEKNNIGFRLTHFAVGVSYQTQNPTYYPPFSLQKNGGNSIGFSFFGVYSTQNIRYNIQALAYPNFTLYFENKTFNQRVFLSRLLSFELFPIEPFKSIELNYANLKAINFK